MHFNLVNTLLQYKYELDKHADAAQEFSLTRTL